MSWKSIRSEAVSTYYPGQTESETLENLYEDISAFIETEFGYETFFAGSAGRGTFMTGDHDIDVFILFPDDFTEQRLEKEGLSIGKQVFEEFDAEPVVEYAEHPYTKGVIEGLDVEIVPCIDTSPSEIRTAVDRSPHHARWVQENLDQTQKEDVVLLKIFLKVGGLYGSSLKTRGFSGYLCELLIQVYGSFKDLVESAAMWEEKEYLDPGDYHKSLPKKLEDKFSEDALVMIDPVDPQRNVASVLTSEKYSEFIYRCWRFKKDPDLSFFMEESFSYEKFELEREIEKRGDFIVLEFESIDIPEDVIYPQMRKTVRRLTDKLEKNGFKIYQRGFHVGDKIRIFFELDSEVPEITTKEGPKIYFDKEYIEDFKDKYENTFISDERIQAKVDKEFSDAKKLIKHFLSEDTEKLRQKGVPRNIAGNLSESKMVRPMIDDDEWLKFLAQELHV